MWLRGDAVAAAGPRHWRALPPPGVCPTLPCPAPAQAATEQRTLLRCACPALPRSGGRDCGGDGLLQPVLLRMWVPPPPPPPSPSPSCTSPIPRLLCLLWIVVVNSPMSWWCVFGGGIAVAGIAHTAQPRPLPLLLPLLLVLLVPAAPAHQDCQGSECHPCAGLHACTLEMLASHDPLPPPPPCPARRHHR